MKLIINKIKRFFKKKKKEDIFIPTYVGLALMAQKETAETIFSRHFGCDNFNQMSLNEKRIMQVMLLEIDKCCKNPGKPDKSVKAFDLTAQALMAFEDYNGSILSAPWLLACIFFKDPRAIDEEVERIFHKEDFRTFWPKYVFFLKLHAKYVTG